MPSLARVGGGASVESIMIEVKFGQQYDCVRITCCSTGGGRRERSNFSFDRGWVGVRVCMRVACVCVCE